MEKPVIVFDNGSGYLKAGLSDQDIPRCTIPALVGRPMLRSGEKIGKLEKNITKKLKKDLNDLESAFDEFTQDSKKEHKSLNDKIRNINENFYDYNAKIDGLIVKTAPLDNLNIFRDSGNGNIDTTKTMIKFLEEKVNKRIAIIEDKTEKDKKMKKYLKINWKN